MGQYFKIVNPAKKQFIDASRFNENVKSSGVLYGYHATAVAFLVCNIDQVRDGWGHPIYDFGELAGSWCGDSVFIVSDDHGKADEFSVKTSTDQNPDRNLYWMAKEEFEDISYKAIAMLCNGREDIAEEMAQRAAASVSPDTELVDLGNVVFYVGCEPLERALAKEYGAEWASRYKKAWLKHPA
ncbi:MAG: hypothetical protein H0W76_27580 [Pyrinomonadaceae bacterium]|nr:hypothetical protein [Pyrinomonadaceae bacterium]